MTAGWTGWEYHTGVFKPSSLPLFSPNYSHSLSITPHNSGKLSNGRNNSNFNLSVPVVSTKKMLSRALRLRLPWFGGQQRGGRTQPPACGCSAETGGKEGSRDGTRTSLLVMGEEQEERMGCWEHPHQVPREPRASSWAGFGAMPAGRRGQPLAPLHRGPHSAPLLLGRTRAGARHPPHTTSTASSALSWTTEKRTGRQLLLKTCFP